MWQALKMMHDYASVTIDVLPNDRNDRDNSLHLLQEFLLFLSASQDAALENAFSTPLAGKK